MFKIKPIFNLYFFLTISIIVSCKKETPPTPEKPLVVDKCKNVSSVTELANGSFAGALHEYDSKGNILKSINLDSLGKPNLGSYTSYTYMDNKLSSISYIWNNKVFSTTKYEYFKNNIIIEKHCDENGLENRVLSYDYDNKNNLIRKEIKHFYKYNEIIDTFSYITTFEDYVNGRPNFSKYYDKNKKDSLELRQKRAYFYDDNMNRIKTILTEVSYNGTEKTPIIESESTFDSNIWPDSYQNLGDNNPNPGNKDKNNNIVVKYNLYGYKNCNGSTYKHELIFSNTISNIKINNEGCILSYNINLVNNFTCNKLSEISKTTYTYK